MTSIDQSRGNCISVSRMWKHTVVPNRKQLSVRVHRGILPPVKTILQILMNPSSYDEDSNVAFSTVYPLPPILHPTLHIPAIKLQNPSKYLSIAYWALTIVRELQMLNGWNCATTANYCSYVHTDSHPPASPSNYTVDPEHQRSSIIPGVLPVLYHDNLVLSVDAKYYFPAHIDHLNVVSSHRPLCIPQLYSASTSYLFELLSGFSLVTGLLHMLLPSDQNQKDSPRQADFPPANGIVPVCSVPFIPSVP